ncbi:MAG: hypothetical protein DI576_05770 [Actinomyces sp.]|nr:MAG: hypothetical protein DI576_05770 [Actinomyces sp.]
MAPGPDTDTRAGSDSGSVVPPPDPLPTPSHERDGVCEAGEVCFYYNSDQQGSVSDFSSSIENYGTSQPGCYDFKGPGAGQGECIKNNAASVENRTAAPVTVYFNSGHKGDTEVIPAGASVNLDEFKNKNASHSIGG